MEIVSTCVDAQRWVRDQHRVDNRGEESNRIGFVPTMGALHDGHLSLIDHALQTCDIVVASIFVNPTQFAPSEDLDKYPRPFDSDIAKLKERGVAMVFAPSTIEMYPDGFSTHVVPPAIANVLEGQKRPGHFDGVVTVVAKLFNAVPADLAVFGQKDFQQFKVIEAMVRDLNFAINLSAAPIIRESDGLAMSSRNTYLTPTDRKRSLAISRSLRDARDAVENGERQTSVLEQQMHQTLTENGDVDSIDYAVIVDADTLEPIPTVSENSIALIAAYVGGTRLIDNQRFKLD